jgi:hypothetical protein
MKTMVNIIDNPTRDILHNIGFYKTVYANELTSNDIGKKIYFIHQHGISCRKISNVSDTHFTHSSLDDSSAAESLIHHFHSPMYMETSRDKLFDTATRIILDNQYGNDKQVSILNFFRNRDLILHTSNLLV